MKEKPNYYAIIPADVRYADITPNAKLLYGEITALCSKEGYCWAGNPYFAGLYHVSRKSVERWLSELEGIGAIEMSGSTSKREIRLPTKMSQVLTTKLSRTTDKNVHDSSTKIITSETATASPVASLKELANGHAAEPMNCTEFYTWTKLSKQAHIKIIGEWADTVKPDLRTRAQWSAFIKRNLRAARMLEAFTADQLSAGFEKIEAANENGWLKKYTLETLLKFIV